MPTYDYRCNACDHEFELFQSMTEKVKRTCPECGKKTLERLIGTGAALLFKGSGFYETDYRSESYKKAAEADKPKSDSAPESKPETKADAKAEKKPDAGSKSTAEKKSTKSPASARPASKKGRPRAASK